MWRIAFEIEHASAPPQQSQSCGTKWAVLLRSVSEWLKGNKCKEGPSISTEAAYPPSIVTACQCNPHEIGSAIRTPLPSHLA